MTCKYTVIKKTLSGQTLSTHHYETKRDAMMEVADAIATGHQVEVMKTPVYLGRCLA